MPGLQVFVFKACLLSTYALIYPHLGQKFMLSFRGGSIWNLLCLHRPKAKLDLVNQSTYRY